jgi:hypothetical protein
MRFGNYLEAHAYRAGLRRLDNYWKLYAEVPVRDAVITILVRGRLPQVLSWNDLWTDRCVAACFRKHVLTDWDEFTKVIVPLDGAVNWLKLLLLPASSKLAGKSNFHTLSGRIRANAVNIKHLLAGGAVICNQKE